MLQLCYFTIMSERIFTKACQRCGAVSDHLSNTCSSCSFAFPTARSPRRSHLTRILTVLAAIFVFDFIILAGTSHRVVTATDAYTNAIFLAQSSPDVQRALGDGIKPRFPAVGWASNSEASRFSVFSVRLAGSHGKGTLYGVANSANGVWELSRLSLRVDEGGQSVDLAPTPRHLSLPPVPKKTIFLIPMDLEPGESIGWAPAYYRLKMDVDVRVLPEATLPKGLEDPVRGQIDSERYVEHIRRTYRQLAENPANVIIAVTSRDIFIRSYGWSFAENYRQDGRFAVISSARMHPFSLFDRWNPEWIRSRVQKMLTKNIAMLYYDLPMSCESTSLLSSGVLYGREIDLMSGSINGNKGHWKPFLNSDDVQVNLYKTSGTPLIWRLAHSSEILPQTTAQVFSTDVTIGLFSYRKTDFRFDGDYPLQFNRVYRNKDPQSRPFGIGANDSLDIFLVGEMGRYIELLMEDGSQIQFVHVPRAVGQSGDTYQGAAFAGSPFSLSRAVFQGDIWTIERTDGWKFYFPYRPKAPGANVTILTGFEDPSGHKYEMMRNDAGDLLSITTPSGQWLHFTRDQGHHVQSISASSGRTVNYQYDAGGRLSRMTDSEGQEERYTYDDKAQMLSVATGSGAPMIVNTYDISGNVTSQSMPDGIAFQYHYTRDLFSRSSAVVPDLISLPNGLFTHFQYYAEGYAQSLPTPPPR
jgi:YD repeat-containing protein